MQAMRTNRQRGFTLIEMLIVAPMVILLIGATIAYLTSLTGKGLQVQAQENMAFELQSALDTIEHDAVGATRFLSTTGTLSSPQGKNNSTTAFTSTDSLITGNIATDKSPVSDGRVPIVYANQPNLCGSTNQYSNEMLIVKNIYFLSDGSLWKRTIIPTYNVYSSPTAVDGYTVCKTPWQRNSCAPNYTDTTTCKTEDEEILKNVTSMSIKYYESASSTTPISVSPLAKTAEITLTAEQTIAGKTISRTGSIKVTRQNDVDSDLVVPAAATIASYNVSCSPDFTMKVICNWSSIPNATAYVVQYSLDGGTTFSSPVTTTNTSYTINTTRGDDVVLKISARNSYGASPSVQTATPTEVPSTVPCDLQNGWQNYGSPYQTASFTRTSAGAVVLSGLIRSGTGVQYEVICNLPPGYRPSSRLIFAPAQGGTHQARIDVDTNGDVIFVFGNTAWTSLTGINFLAAGVASWTNLTGVNGWIPYGSVYAPPQATTDSTGRAWVQGLAKGGTATSSVTAFNLPSNIDATSNRDIYPAGVSGATVTGSMDININKTIIYRAGGNGYFSLQAMYYPTSAGTWTSLPLSNGWSTYATGYSSAQYIKNADDIVSLRGLIKGGTITGGTVVATLPLGYRPPAILLCSVITNSNTFARIDVYPNGQVKLMEGVNASWLSLAGCDFLAEQ